MCLFRSRKWSTANFFPVSAFSFVFIFYCAAKSSFIVPHDLDRLAPAAAGRQTIPPGSRDGNSLLVDQLVGRGNGTRWVVWTNPSIKQTLYWHLATVSVSWCQMVARRSSPQRRDATIHRLSQSSCRRSIETEIGWMSREFHWSRITNTKSRMRTTNGPLISFAWRVA